jgi:hypothetical protein
MKEILKISPSRLEIHYPIILDPKFLTCISLARLSKSDSERYGAVFTKEEMIKTGGYNRCIAHSTFKLERKIRMGYANHAEIECVDFASVLGINTKDGDIFVAGYFPSTGRIFFKREYTCDRCIPYMQKFQIKNIFDPMPKGWIEKPLCLAAIEAEKYVGGKHGKRLKVTKGNIYLQQIEDRLLGKNELDPLINN